MYAKKISVLVGVIQEIVFDPLFWYSENMTTITIPKHFAGKDLVLVPKEEYEALQERANFALPLNYKIVRMTMAQKRELEAAKKDYKRGDFVTIDVLKRDVERRSSR
ncbi:MAG: hypothetical protein UX89_C0024G0004 [Parcubacteria group bacterium GW2011_GWA2_47_16]|nr:MAG: hypothetical protein UX89_C0024G0004 [Parcubacteria group bacterium GW2011_GWA2_47_16]